MYPLSSIHEWRMVRKPGIDPRSIRSTTMIGGSEHPPRDYTGLFLMWIFLLAEKWDIRPSQTQRYLGIRCDSSRAIFHVLQDKLD